MAQARILLSAFADEISPDPAVQLRVLKACGIRHLELRSAFGTNVLDLTDAQLADLKKRMADEGISLSAIGSPIGKIKLSDPWEPHLARFERACDVALRLGTPNIRIFSFYPHEDGRPWAEHRDLVISRLRQLTIRAALHNLRLLHENESRIYGESPDHVIDLMKTMDSPHFRAVFDAGNYVHGGFDPLEAWQRTRDWTVHFHIKDWLPGGTQGVVVGQGQGRYREVLADAIARGYHGFATLEPHLLGGGPTGGATGPELFPQAAKALTQMLADLGLPTD